MSEVFIGLDLSLTGTGYCAVDSTGEIIESGVIVTKKLPKDYRRIKYIRDEIREFLTKFASKSYKVFVEGYSFGSKGRSVFDIAELGGIVRMMLIEEFNSAALVPPTSLKKWVCGKGNAKKDLMLLNAFKKFGKEFDDDNECDAYCLARFGMKYLDQENWTKQEEKDFEKIVWIR